MSYKTKYYEYYNFLVKNIVCNCDSCNANYKQAKKYFPNKSKELDDLWNSLIYK